MIENEKRNRGSLVYAIVGVCTLILAVVGATYAYYQASVSNTNAVTGEAGGGAAPEMTISKVSSVGTKGNKLIPIDETVAMLNNAAKATNQCVDKNGYTVCDVYKVEVTNKTDTATAFDISLNIPAVKAMPYLSAITMGTTNNTVTAIDRIGTEANGTARAIDGKICTTNSVTNAKTTACYFMVYIKNKDSAQTDSSTYHGTVTAESTIGGGRIQAEF